MRFDYEHYDEDVAVSKQFEQRSMGAERYSRRLVRHGKRKALRLLIYEKIKCWQKVESQLKKEDEKNCILYISAFAMG